MTRKNVTSIKKLLHCKDTQENEFLGSRKISIAEIKKHVAEYHGIREELMVGKSRYIEYLLPRQIAMYLARQLTDLSLPNIGRYLGGRDHTTVMHAVSKISRLVAENPHIRTKVGDLTEIILAEPGSRLKRIENELANMNIKLERLAKVLESR